MKIKRFLVDTLALNIFIVLVAVIVEMVLSGISWSIFWRGRLVMILPNIITVEPYNLTRRWIGKKLTFRSQSAKQIVRDTAVFVLFRVPLIFLVLLFLGTPMTKVLTACAAATLVSGFTGRPYGVFLDWMRKRFNMR